MLLLIACAATTESAADPCADVPVVSWESFGAGFVTESCQTCHASTSPDRHDAPEDVVFDTAEDVWAHKDRVLATVTGDAPSMPPQGGLSEDDRYKLEAWLTCGSEGE